MPLARWFRIALVALLIGLCVPWSAEAEGAAPLPFSARSSDWGRVIEWAQRYVASRDYGSPRSQEHIDRVTVVRVEAATAKEEAQREVESTQRLIDALGLPPKDGEAPEAGELAAKRRQYGDTLALHRAHVAQAEVAITQAKAMEQTISNLRRVQLVDKLQTRLPLPVAPGVLATAFGDVVATVGQLARSPFNWYERLTAQQRDGLDIYRFGIIVVLGSIAGALLQRMVLRRFGHDPTIEAPTYGRRLMAAIAEGVGRGLVPGAFLGAIFVWIDRPGALISGLFEDVVGSLLIILVFLVQVGALSRAVLAPDLPAWRLTNLAPDNARLLNHRILFLALVFGVDMFFHLATEHISLSPELLAVHRLVFLIPEALGILALCRTSLWVNPTTEASAPTAETTVVALRRAVAAISVAAVVAAAAGYSDFGAYLIHNMLFTAVIAVALALARGLLQELVGLMMQSQALRQRLDMRTALVQRLDFLIRAALDPALLVVGVMVVGPLWGVPRDDLTRWARSFLTGIPIGNVTISIIDILTAVAVFLGAMMVTRTIQRRLSERILPATRFDDSTRHSLVAGFGYLGVILAAAVSITVAGIDLTNLALLAGALSVGIGFGLQNIVNNFVSGLILLVERPIRVGDWVVVGTSEGLVRRISIRATELETWERASVVIPNADILSGKVMNWTLKDKLGRIDIKVGVAYGSDLQKVSEVLLSCAHDHPRVLDDPPPFVLFQDFGDSALMLELRCFTSDVLNRGRFASDMRFDLERRFRQWGIDIPYPQRTVHVSATPGTSPAAAGLAPPALASHDIG